MNVSILHIVRKDLRRLRYLVVLWFLIIIVDCLFESGMIALESFGDMQKALSVMTFLKTLAAFILVAFLVLEDSLVDTNAFWLTRPISGRRLFLAKAFFAVFFVVIPPVLAEFAAILLNHGTLHQAFLGTAPLLVDILMLTVVTGLLASFSVTLGQLVVAVFFLFIGVGLLTVRAYSSPFANPFTRWLDQFGNLFRDAHLILSAALVSDVLLVIIGTIILCSQFRTRMTIRSAAAAILAFIYCITIGGFWSVDLLSPCLASAVEYADGIPEIANPDGIRTIEESGYGYQSGNSRKRVVGNIRFTNLKRGYQAVSHVAPLGWARQGFQKSDDLGSSEDAVFNSTDLHALTGVIRGRYISGNWNPSLQTLALLPADEYKSMENRSTRYQAAVDADIFHYRELGAIPIKPNASVEKNGNRITIRGINRYQGNLRIEIDERYLSLIYDREDATRRRDWRHVPWLTFVLRNRRNNEILLAVDASNSYFLINSQGTDRSVKLAQFSQKFALPPSVSPLWFDDAELIVVDAVLVDRISRRVDWNLKIPGPNQPWSEEPSAETDTSD